MFGNSRRFVAARAFTLVEMMIAMAVTLLLMAALAKAFNTIGQNVRESRVAVSTNSRLRDVTFRLKDELSRCTANVADPHGAAAGTGYFVYYEGPLSDASGVLMGESPSATNEMTLQDSKFGDFDDYIAFTAEAKGDNWFRGKVPRFILDVRTAEVNGVAYNPNDFPGNPTDPVVITSKFAEIIYFASPDYQTSGDPADRTTLSLVYDAAGNPVIADADSDTVPDAIRLHRRVLLIRPDLNLTSGSMAGGLPTFTDSSGTFPYTYMSPDMWFADQSGQAPAIRVTGQQPLAWLLGMSVVHQQCDLSVRRVIGADGLPGMGVAANSLDDLKRPENRFAHIRVPPHVVGIPLGGSIGYTSMPVLALGGLQPMLARVAGSVAPPATPNSAPYVTPSALNGFLRPEFVLGMDLTHSDSWGDAWGLERLGEDVLASNVIGFDIKGFDPTVRLFLTPGADGGYGKAGMDDNLDGTPDNIAEAGASNSDDVLVGPNDPGYSTVLRAAPPSAAGQPPVPALQGDFVDLFYAFQAGGTLRGLGSRQRDIHSTFTESAVSTMHATAYLQSDLSGFTASSSYPLPYVDGLYKSGRLVISGSGAILLLQPAYDTFSDHYETDGFLQADGADVAGSAGGGTLWWRNLSDGTAPPAIDALVDRGADGLDVNSLGADDVSERETMPPFPTGMSAVQIRIRLENPTTGQVMQMSAAAPFER